MTFSRERLKPGMVIRVDFRNDEGKTWTHEGTLIGHSWNDHLILDGPDGVYGWDCVEAIELVSLLPPEDD